MNKTAAYASHFLALLLSLAAFAVAARAQSSLVFSDPAGRMVEFTNFGTIVYPNQRIVTRGYEVVYDDGAGLKRAWYLNSLNHSGIIPVSLSADQPNGHKLGAGQAVYVKARMKTADNKLEIHFRYILKDGAPGIEVVVTLVNTSNSSLDIAELSFTTPPSHECQCPCDPVREFDGSVLQNFLISAAPNVRYRKTRAVFTSPTISKNESRDIPGCDPRPDTRLPIN